MLTKVYISLGCLARYVSKSLLRRIDPKFIICKFVILLVNVNCCNGLSLQYLSLYSQKLGYLPAKFEKLVSTETIFISIQVKDPDL